MSADDEDFGRREDLFQQIDTALIAHSDAEEEIHADLAIATAMHARADRTTAEAGGIWPPASAVVTGAVRVAGAVQLLGGPLLQPTFVQVSSILRRP